MDDDKILERGGTQEDINNYANSQGADLKWWDPLVGQLVSKAWQGGLWHSESSLLRDLDTLLLHIETVTIERTKKAVRSLKYPKIQVPTGCPDGNAGCAVYHTKEEEHPDNKIIEKCAEVIK